MIAAYGVANLLQSVAATRTTVHHTFDPGLLLRLAGHRTYLIGLSCQVLGFVLAFLARRDLPLFLVQASASTSGQTCSRTPATIRTLSAAGRARSDLIAGERRQKDPTSPPTPSPRRRGGVPAPV